VTGRMLISSAMLSPGYNHFGGILGFLFAFEWGFLRSTRKENA